MKNRLEITRGDTDCFLNAFSPDYAVARDRFRHAARQRGWDLEHFELGQPGPHGEELTVDVARTVPSDASSTLVVSSGVHGVEAYFGSAVQIALMELSHWELPASQAAVFIHGLNPYGFAWRRRFNESNVDLNRNFLLPGEAFRGSPTKYAELNLLLNPSHPPSRYDFFLPRALWAIVRQGMPALRQAIAGGQYDYPQGLFFGGHHHEWSVELVQTHLPRWVGANRPVVHLDFHTGLGEMATHRLLIDYDLTSRQRDQLTRWFGAGSFEASDSRDIAYDSRGGFGQWAVASHASSDYLFLCAEFGTYSPLRVLSGLREENQAFHHCPAGSALLQRARERLQELFCPASPEWRRDVTVDAVQLVHQAAVGLAED